MYVGNRQGNTSAFIAITQPRIKATDYDPDREADTVLLTITASFTPSHNYLISMKTADGRNLFPIPDNNHDRNRRGFWMDQYIFHCRENFVRIVVHCLFPAKRL